MMSVRKEAEFAVDFRRFIRSQVFQEPEGGRVSELCRDRFILDRSVKGSVERRDDANLAALDGVRVIDDPEERFSPLYQCHCEPDILGLYDAVR